MKRAQPVQVWVGTRKGAFVFRSENRKTWARSRDSGKTWTLLTKGLPQENAHLMVFREAMASDPLTPADVYFGTGSGSMFYTRNAGESWHTLARNLPPVYSVTIA